MRNRDKRQARRQAERNRDDMAAGRWADDRRQPYRRALAPFDGNWGAIREDIREMERG